MVAYLGQVITKDAAGRGSKAVATAIKDVEALHRHFGDIVGKSSIPVSTKAANAFGATRNVITSAFLGSATFTALSDTALQRIAAKFNGLPVMGVMTQFLKGFTPHVTEHQRFALRLGLGAESWVTMALGQLRYMGEVVGPRWSQMFSDGVLRLSLLTPWTAAGRTGFGMEFAGHLGQFVGKAFSDMPSATQRALRLYEIDETAWARIPTEALMEHQNKRMFLATSKLTDLDEELGNKIAQMILSETEFAVPTVTPRVRAQLRFGTRPGTFAGEAMRSTAMFKSFPVSIINLHLMRGLNLSGGSVTSNYARRASYISQLIVTTTFMAALGYQLRQLAAGRTLEDMTTKEFWGKAFIKGGGMGLYADFLFQDPDNTTRNFFEFVGGPVVGLVGDALDLSVGSLLRAGKGDDPQFAKKLARITERYSPGGTIWYARLILDRYIFDTFERMADPDFDANTRRMESNLRRDTGQRMTWRRGQRLPTRGPDFRAAIGQ
jgi:hypothetical protein